MNKAHITERRTEYHAERCRLFASWSGTSAEKLSAELLKRMAH